MEQQKAKSEKVVLENRTLNKEITELRHELETTKTESEKCKTAFNLLEKKYDFLKNHFSSPVILLDKYRNLPISIRNGLSDIICDKDEILFIASCSSPEHLKAIWNYTKALAVNNANENELNIMKEIFDYFFDVFNHSLSEPVYERDKVEPGIIFDDEKFGQMYRQCNIRKNNRDSFKRLQINKYRSSHLPLAGASINGGTYE